VTPIQIVAVCLRFLAIVWLLNALNDAYGALTYLLVQSEVPDFRWFVWAQAALQLAICCALWFFPTTIATKLLPSYARPTDSHSPPGLLEWQTLGVICIGLWALSRAVPDLVYWGTYMGMALDGDSPVSQLSADQRAGLLATFAEIAIGLWLVLGAKGAAALLFKIRTAGIAK
jgi:hypothetical protein